MDIINRILLYVFLLFSFSCSHTKEAIEPIVKTKGPLIYLADNLGEDKKLGWCIDTEGKGFNELLQSHSCKPEGADTQFKYDSSSKNILSVTYKGKCMTLNEASSTTHPFALLNCKLNNPKQQFFYSESSQEFQPILARDHCVAVAEKINDAGPYQSRDLIVAPCQSLDNRFKSWIVRN